MPEHNTMHTIVYFRFQLVFFLFFFFVQLQDVSAQQTEQEKDTLVVLNDSLSKDTLSVPKDTSISDNAINSKVQYNAEDSIRFDVEEQKVYLFGKAEIKYENIILKAAYIEINWEDKTVYATGIKDSSGNMQGLPVYEEGEQNFKANTMRYNFDTKKGKITYVTTKEGGGVIHGETVKKDSSNTFFVKNGRYTTCEDESIPHFYIATKKLKIIQNNKIVTGPAYLVLEDIPTPFVIPFGFFPNKNGQTSGILIPAYGESPSLGFFLTNGGYYFGFSDYADLTVRGDIYSKGSWRINTASSYAKRYKFTGDVNLNYSEMKTSEKGFSDYGVNSDFFIRWNHSQDVKARPGSRFSANVNAGSSSYFRKNITSSTSDFLSNTFSSAVAYSKNWKNSNLSVNLRHNQNTINKTIDLGLPDMSFSVNRFYPFKTKKQIGEEKWFEKIGVTYSSVMQNSISTYDSLLFKKESLSKFKNGVKHSIPVSTSFKVFKYFSLSPSLNQSWSWYAKNIRKQWVKKPDTEQDTMLITPVKGFKTVYDFGVSASLNTRIYGMFVFKKSPVKAIRHVMTPSIGTSWRPDFSTPFWKYYDSTMAGNGTYTPYSYFEGAVYGAPPSGKSGMVNLSLDNNLEMKVKNKKDSVTGEKKIKLLESFSIATGYNIAADSMNWSTVNVSGRTVLLDKISVTFGGNIDLYTADSTGRRSNKFEWKETGKAGRFTNGNIAVSFNLNQAANLPKTSKKATEAEMNMVNNHADEYVDFNIPWNLNVNYNLNYVKFYGTYAPDKKPKEVTQSLNFSGDLNITPKWKIGFSSGYDFINKTFTHTSVDVFRDLHCWEMKFHWIPFGSLESYNFQINVKSSVLQDLKLVRKRDWYDK